MTLAILVSLGQVLSGAAAPKVEILSPAEGETTGPTGSIVFGASGAATFTCVLDGGAAISCASPWPFTLGEGPHSVTVRAIRGGGRRPDSGTTRTWLVDATGPVVTISSPTEGLTTGPTGSIVFESPGPATFTCRLDDGAAVPCVSPAPFTLGEGLHTIAVQGTDQFGNVGSAVNRTWLVDATGPVVTISSPTEGQTTGPTGSIVFGSAGPDTFTCLLDGGAAVPCVSPAPFTLGEGLHTIAVQGTDPVGNVGSAATRTWLVDATGPVVTISSPQPGMRTSPTGNIVVGATEAATFTCALDGGAAVPCVSPVRFGFVAPAEGMEEPHSIIVEGTDQFGNRGSAYIAWLVATTGVVTIASPAEGETTGPIGHITFTDPTFTDPDLRCFLDDALVPCHPAQELPFTLDEGPHTITVLSFPGFSIATRSWRVAPALPEWPECLFYPDPCEFSASLWESALPGGVGPSTPATDTVFNPAGGSFSYVAQGASVFAFSNILQGSLRAGDLSWQRMFASSLGGDPVPVLLRDGAEVVFVVSLGGFLHALNALDGGEIWAPVDTKRPNCLGDKVIATPAVQRYDLSNASFRAAQDQDLVFVITRTFPFVDAECFDEGNNRVFAIKAMTGEVAWVFEPWVSDTLPMGYGSEACSLDYGTNTLYCGTEQISAFPFDPVRTLWAIDTTNGSLRWATSAGAIRTSPWLRGGRVYAATFDGVLKAYNSADGTLVYSSAPFTTAKVQRNPWLGSGSFYDGWILITDTAGYLHALYEVLGPNAAVWKTNLGGVVTTAPVGIPSLGRAWVGMADGTVHQINLGGIAEAQATADSGIGVFGAVNGLSLDTEGGALEVNRLQTATPTSLRRFSVPWALGSFGPW